MQHLQCHSALCICAQFVHLAEYRGAVHSEAHYHGVLVHTIILLVS